jgi:hypothetical protein
VLLFDPVKGPIREVAKAPNTLYDIDISPDAKQLAWTLTEWEG